MWVCMNTMSPTLAGFHCCLPAFWSPLVFSVGFPFHFNFDCWAFNWAPSTTFYDLFTWLLFVSNCKHLSNLSFYCYSLPFALFWIISSLTFLYLLLFYFSSHMFFEWLVYSCQISKNIHLYPSLLFFSLLLQGLPAAEVSIILILLKDAFVIPTWNPFCLRRNVCDYVFCLCDVILQ